MMSDESSAVADLLGVLVTLQMCSHDVQDGKSTSRSYAIGDFTFAHFVSDRFYMICMHRGMSR